MEQDVYKAPESNLNIEQEGPGTLASRWARLGASMVDAIVVMCITIPLMYVTGGFSNLEAGPPGLVYSFVIGLVGILAFALINGKFLLSNGQTLGKKLLKIKIVTTDTRYADLTTLAKRYGFNWGIALVPVIGQFLGLVNVLFIFGKTKRCLHDFVGGTKVINA